MTVPCRRLLLAVLLGCAVTTGLAACTPIDEDPTVAMAPDDLDGDLGADDTEEYWALPDAEAELDAAAAGSAPVSSPSACSTHPGHRVIQVLDVTDGRLTARPTRFVCTPDDPEEAGYEPVGDPVVYPLAAHATATLVDVDHDDPAKEVQLPVLLTHLDACLTGREPEAPYGCHGDTYDVVLDARGRITRIEERGRPAL
ncbi:hypothetical protein [Kitasatospora sp. NPDC093806]|uniref:hypothetical protein n=1 Tax=Kitasatospora sp. NPDC093806 TaxID=3155075 RepID=UPI003423D198